MTLNELYTILTSTGLPVAYSHFPEKQSLPFVTYVVAYSSNFKADNKVMQKIENIQVELYTAKKDLVTEELLETALRENSIPWEVVEAFLEEENCFQRIYEITI